jgi:hypothetical protein
MIAAGIDIAIAIVAKRPGHSQISITGDAWGHRVAGAGYAATAVVPSRVLPRNERR